MTIKAKPLAGIRVLDLGIITAGAATSAILADLGAEVIKVESPTYRDPFRIWVAMREEDKKKLSPHFRATNRGKRSVAINVKTPEGRACLLKLAEHCDVVVENFRRGVMDNLGIGFAALKAANPKIVLASISSQGETGPDALYVSYGSTLESMAGMAWLTGYAGEAPMVSGVDLNYPDQVVAIFAAGVICTALQDRERNEALHLDLSQRELTSFLISDAFAETLPDDAQPSNPRLGNGDPEFFLQDCFQAMDGRWVALSVTEAERQRLEDLAGSGGIAPWIAAQDAEKAAASLQEAGLAAAVNLSGEAVLAAQEWQAGMTTASDGQPLKGSPFVIDGLDARPDEIGDFGAETVAVLKEIAGFTDRDLAHLADAGAIPAPVKELPKELL
ncbi:CaiB/BaiF CoA transferase family protein [Neorhizobium alkalisoli]|uniref:Crotonobetainyl-CoA:carnitine CoA-transferase CaiB-like acyl-CoA transferase n=1 Tax=Neorhizobium alkalisoli TaxID=528178 RepID=A0A561QAQ8_9HYPH|nr:CoA transferase [Neorhizobium alkalisoli]TWF47421.1 crotonobetainyl-CoA:carnitine CoA-transferase CaiB-like acyl-CoA transferase [Neorhizobium alkalisoli]